MKQQIIMQRKNTKEKEKRTAVFISLPSKRVKMDGILALSTFLRV